MSPAKLHNTRLQRSPGATLAGAAEPPFRYADRVGGVVICILLLALSACSKSSEDPGLSRAIAQKAAGPEGNELRIAEMAPHDWSRFCVFPPYSDKKRIESALGFAWNMEPGIEVQEGSSLLVLTRGKRVDSWVMHPRNEGDFAALGEPYCRERADAVFVTTKGTDERAIVEHASK